MRAAGPSCTAQGCGVVGATTKASATACPATAPSSRPEAPAGSVRVAGGPAHRRRRGAQRQQHEVRHPARPFDHEHAQERRSPLHGTAQHRGRDRRPEQRPDRSPDPWDKRPGLLGRQAQERRAPDGPVAASTGSGSGPEFPMRVMQPKPTIPKRTAESPARRPPEGDRDGPDKGSDSASLAMPCRPWGSHRGRSSSPVKAHPYTSPCHWMPASRNRPHQIE